MIRIENTRVFGFEPALENMRNPKESWHKSDSHFYGETTPPNVGWGEHVHAPENPEIGPNDLKLAKRLIKSGSSHRKFLREIEIWVTIHPTRAVWQEIDTYKVATVRSSCSTIHKLGHRSLDEQDFKFHAIDPDKYPALRDSQLIAESSVTTFLNEAGKVYRKTKDYDLVRAMKGMLPEGFIQRAGYHMSYENALSMFGQRRKHQLEEWRFTGKASTGPYMSICDWIASLPYMCEFIYAAFY